VDVSGVTYPSLMLLLDLPVEFQHLHEFGKNLWHTSPGEEALNGPLCKVVAKNKLLVHEEQDHGQNSVPTEVRPSDRKFVVRVSATKVT